MSAKYLQEGEGKMKINYRYEQSYDSKNKENMQVLIEHILECNYGETVPLSLCAKTLGYNIDNDEEFKKFQSAMARVRDTLIDFGYVLKSISGIGYYILKPKQIASHCYRSYVKRSARILSKSERILEHTAQSELSEIRQEEFDNFKKLNDELIEKIDNTILKSRYYNRMNYYKNLDD